MQLEVAAYGWLDEAWSGSYPEDLPLEWRLDYYANEYRAVVVPVGHWHGCDDETLTQWLEEAHDAFEFYWELGSNDDARRLLSLYQSQDGVPSPGGWLLLPDCQIDSALEQELMGLAPVVRCNAAGDCEGELSILTARKEGSLRQLRAQLDVLKASQVSMVLLVVRPSVDAGVTLEQLETLCQLYGG